MELAQIIFKPKEKYLLIFIKLDLDKAYDKISSLLNVKAMNKTNFPL